MRLNDNFDDHRVYPITLDNGGKNLFGYIAIHNTVRGPALGGVRMFPYQKREAAWNDVLRLSRGMTYKAALAGIPFGGGKAVIGGDPEFDKTEQLMESFGKAVENLNGHYITAEDVGTTMDDMEIIARQTRYVAGRKCGSGDPSLATSLGVFHGIKACLDTMYGSPRISHDRFEKEIKKTSAEQTIITHLKSLMNSPQIRGKVIAIKGLGNVGMHLAELLERRGATLILADCNLQKVILARARFPHAEIADYKEIHTKNAHVYAPCALGAEFNAHTVEELNCDIIAGCANNQLATPQDGDRIHERGILYAPDYVINAGGVINIANEFAPIGFPDNVPYQYSLNRAIKKIEEISATLRIIFQKSHAEAIPTHRIADMMAQEALLNIPINMISTPV